MKKTIFALLAVLLLLSGCSDVLQSPAKNTEPVPAPGTGLVRVSLGIQGISRTVMPDSSYLSGLYYTLDFSADGQTPVNKTLSGGVLNVVVQLAPAVWTLEIEGYTDSTKTTLMVSGSTLVTINAGTTANIEVPLSATQSGEGTGTLTYNIQFPATVSSATLSVSPINAGAGTEIDLIGVGANGSIPSLPAGEYSLLIQLYDDTNNKAAALTQTAHVYKDLTTPLTRTFGAADFYALPALIPGDSLSDKFDAALASPSGSYTIVLDNSETDLAAFFPKTLNVSGNKDITIHVRGGAIPFPWQITPAPCLPLARRVVHGLPWFCMMLSCRARAQMPLRC
jgi:hypothetical protein